LVYNIIEGPRVVLSLKSGRFREVFSTKRPEEVIKVVRQQKGIHAERN